MKKTMNRAFTLIEIMIVVLIIGILLAIAVPNFVRAREASRAKACVANLKQIDSAKEQWAMDNRATTGGSAPAPSGLSGSAGYIKTEPACPSSGTYSSSAVGTSPSCTVGSTQSGGVAALDHILP